jgi:hypothetical protein
LNKSLTNYQGLSPQETFMMEVPPLIAVSIAPTCMLGMSKNTQ